MANKLSHDKFLQLKREYDEMVKNKQSFQDKWEGENRGTRCWGCGRDNEYGLQIKSCWVGNEAICIWQPKPYHGAFLGVLNGGIIATVMDCHCLNTAVAGAYRAERREIETKPFISYVSGSLQVKYLCPAFTEKPILLRARVEEIKGRKITVTCSLFSEGIEEECAYMEFVAVNVF